MFHCLRSLFWFVVLLAVMQFTAAIGMTQVMQTYIIEGSADDEMKAFVYEYFGHWSRSMLTIFDMTIAPGAWSKVGRPLVINVSPLYAFFFVTYMSTVTFALTRVISAIFLSQTVKSMAKDDEIANHEQVLKHNDETAKLRAIFETTDVDGSGCMDKLEFQQVFTDSRVKRWLQDLGLEVTEVIGLFNLIDDGDGRISFDEFVSGVMRFRGHATNIDLATLLYETRRIRELVAAISSNPSAISRKPSSADLVVD